MVKTIHTVPIKGFLVINKKSGKSQVKIVITTAERRQENKEWLCFASGMLSVKPLEITNLQKIYNGSCKEIVLEQRN